MLPGCPHPSSLFVTGGMHGSACPGRQEPAGARWTSGTGSSPSVGSDESHSPWEKRQQVVVSRDTVVVACTGSTRATRCSGVPVRPPPFRSPRGPATPHAEETTPQTRLPVTQPPPAAWLLPCFSQLPWLFTSVGARCSGAKKQAVARRAEFVRLRRSSPAHPRGAADRAPLRASPPAPPRLALRALAGWVLEA